MGARDGDVLLGGRDEAGRRLAAVQLAELKAATQKQIAAASGTDPVTVPAAARTARPASSPPATPQACPPPASSAG